VIQKLRKAYCPEGVTKDNPVLEMCKYIIFPSTDTFHIHRPEKYGGDLSFDTYSALEQAFSDRQVHPLDLKNAAAAHLNDILKPVRTYFDKHPENLNAIEVLIR
jgi:tyrosyl-tRNA synthetase